MRSVVWVWLVVGVIGLSVATHNIAQAVEASTPDCADIDLAHLSYVHELLHLSEAYPDQIWPSLDYREIPIVIYRPDSIAYLFNHPEPPSEFSPIQTLPWESDPPICVHHGPFRNFVGQMWIWEDIAGRSALVYPYGPDSTWESRFMLTVAHEAFHTYQVTGFADLGDSREELYPLTNVDNIALATLENLILIDALTALENENHTGIITRAAEFVTVRERRWHIAPDFVGHHERVKERTENTAFYVETKLAELGGREEYRPTDFADYARFNPYRTRSMVLQDLRDGIAAHITNGAIDPMAMPRYRIYDNGAALGYMLDVLGPDNWKEIVSSDTLAAYHELLLQALAGETLDTQLEAIKERYGYDTIHAAAAANVHVYLDEVRELEETIKSQGHCCIEVAMLTAGGLSKSKRSRARVLYADDGRATLIESADRFVLENPRGSVAIKNHGLTYRRSEDRDTAYVCTYIQDGPDHAVFDGQKRRLSPGQYSADSAITCTIGDVIAVHGERGTITVSDTLVSIVIQ
ncbi:MAG: hypothetical protein GF341_00185 [candidate division Zixibacteria bacterium]|nr:hypothetical protein [candidate division Zixibacteria bacterium]